MQDDQAAQANSYPLAVAARILGISSDALRMRIRRGRAKGFKKGGRLFAVIEPDELVLAGQAGPGAASPAEKTGPVGSMSELSRPAMTYRTQKIPDSRSFAALAARVEELETRARRDRELLGSLHGRIAELEALLSAGAPRPTVDAEVESEELVLVPEAVKLSDSPAKAAASGEDERRAELIARLSTLGLAPEERRSAAEIVDRLLGNGGDKTRKT